MTTSLDRGVSTRDEWTCGSCSFSIWSPVLPLRVSHVGLYEDERFPGRCLLVLDRHYENIADVEEQILTEYLADLQDLSRAVGAATGAARVDYAVLGNAVPHVHWHVIPRSKQEACFWGAPWADAREWANLSPEASTRLASALRAQLTGISREASSKEHAAERQPEV